mgnify:CR=1 FL=1
MTTADTATTAALQGVPGIPCSAEGPVFTAPWQAQAFAMALSLQQKGVFTWGEWATMIGEEIRKDQAGGDPDTGETYYQHWLATLERMVIAKGLTDAYRLVRHYEAWEHAAERTPHGTPIELRPADFEH